MGATTNGPFKVYNNRLYSGRNDLKVFDLSNPLAPRYIFNQNIDQSSVTGLSFQDDLVFVSGGGKVYIYQISE